MNTKVSRPNFVAPWTRVLILIVSLLIIGLLSQAITGSFLPEDPLNSLIFQNALLLVVLGSALLESHFTKPADSIVNSLTGIITLLPVYQFSPSIAWWSVFIYCTIVLFLSTVCTAISSGKQITGWQQKVARFTYFPSVFFGRARLLFSILFIFGVISFYGLQSPHTLELMLFWGFFVVIWPLGLPELISSIQNVNKDFPPIGSVYRTDWPNIVRAVVYPDTNWTAQSPKLFQQVDNNQSIVIPLFQEIQGDQLVGTGLIIKNYGNRIPGLIKGNLLSLTVLDFTSHSRTYVYHA